MSEKFSIAKTYESLGGQTRIKSTSGKVSVLCPIHTEREASCSLNLDTDLWKCFKCDIGGDAVTMVMRVEFPTLQGKDAYRAAFAYLRAQGIEGGDHPRSKPAFVAKEYTPRETLANEIRLQYTFVDRTGKAIYDEIRIEGEDDQGNHVKGRPFMRRRLPKGRWFHTQSSYRYYDDNGDLVPYGPKDPSPIELPRYYADGRAVREPHSPYLYDLRGMERVLYRLPEVRATAARGGVVVFTEGLKKCDKLARRTGLSVTSVAGGAHGTLEDSMRDDLAGANGLLLLCDSDEAGYASALNRAIFFNPVIPDVRVIDLYGDTSKRDVDDWMDELGRANAETITAQLQTLADRAARIEPNNIVPYAGPFPSLARRQPALALRGAHR